MSQTANIVYIVDDDDSLRKALVRLLEASGYRVAAFNSAAAFLEARVFDQAGCILLDVNMPEVSGLQLQEHLVKLRNILPIIFLTGHGDIAMSVRAVKAGAEDFLSKPVDRATLLPAIERAIARCDATRAQQGQLHDMQKRLASLTAREHEVFSLLILGQLNKQVAYTLGNTERTVKAHRASIMEKMQVGSMAELVLIASRLGLLGQGPGGSTPQ